MRSNPTSKSLRRSLVPTIASLAIHGALFAVIVTVTVEHLQPEPERPRLLDITSLPSPEAGQPAPETPPAPQQDQPDHQASPSPDRARADSTLARRIESARTEAASAFTEAATVAPPQIQRPAAPPPVVRPRRAEPAAAFAGVQASAATRIVYAVDTSGSMVHTLSFVLDELARSVGRLQPTQSFQILLFSDLPGSPVTRSPPIQPDSKGLIRATSRNKAAARDWLATVVAGGRSAPVAGLEAALALNPDLVFLLARGIQRTGSDDALLGTSPDATLARLNTLNPADPRTGYRPAVIKTLQFIEEDPTGLMPRIARTHGDGAGSYRLVTPDDLGQDAPSPASPDDLPPETKSALARAADALAGPERSLAALAVLNRIATDEERAAVRTAADTALNALAGIPPATPRTADPRPHLLRARAAVLLSAAQQAATEQADQSDPDSPAAAWRDDLARRALADAAPLPIIDPAADADRDLTTAQAARLLGRPAEAHDQILPILENAVDADLDAPTLAAAEIARLTAATDDDPTGTTAARARTTIASHLDADRRDSARSSSSPWADPAWRAAAAAALSRSLRLAGQPDDAVLAPLLAELTERSVPEPQRRAVVAPRLTAVAADLPGLPPIALRALADHAAWTGRPRDAADLLLRAHAIEPDPESLRDAAAHLRAAGDPRAPELFFQLATTFPDHPDAGAALTIALGPSDPNAPGFDPTPRRLRAALDAAPSHPLAPAWRTALARTTRGLPGLELLDPIEPLTSEAAALAIELLDELLAANPGDPDLLRRAAGIAERSTDSLTPGRRLDLAESLLATDPARALDTLDDLGRDQSLANQNRAELLRLRALIATDQTAQAFTLAKDLADRLEPAQGDPVGLAFWEAATLWLELGATRGGPDARAAARAHIARLRRIDPTLGGEPWARRLDALAR